MEAAEMDARSISQSSSSSKSIWEDIDLSESYLVCCMFEEAASLASSIIRRMHDATGAVHEEQTKTLDVPQFNDIMESAGMVFVQALNELGRKSNLFGELKALYGSVPAIPGQVFLTGACIQIATGHGMMLMPIFEQFFNAWKFVDGCTCVLLNIETDLSFLDGSRQPLLDVETYLEIVDVYIVQLIGTILRDLDFAISWTEKSDLPQEKQQELLQRLHSLYRTKESGPSHTAPKLKNKTCTPTAEVIEEPLSSQKHHIESSSSCYISRATRSCLWLFHTFYLKCANLPVVRQHGKLTFWSTIFFLICYMLRKKRAAMQWIAAKHARSIRKILADFWQLAFSVEVNPLAAVQSLPSSSHGWN